VAIYYTGCTGHLKPRFYRNKYLWITYSEADICISAADRIQTAASLNLKKLKSILFWCGSFVGLCSKIIFV